MAEKPSWQSQNFSKNAGAAGPSSMNSKIAGSNPMSLHSKIARPTVRNYADGGSVDDETYKSAEYQSDKAAGLEASKKDEPVGFFKRLSMGNIDDPTSEAYKTFGAGRGQKEREFDEAEKSFQGLKSVSGVEAKPASASDDQSAAETARLQRQNDSGASAPVASVAAPRSRPAAASKPSAPKAAPVASTSDQSGAETKRLASAATGTSAAGGKSVMFKKTDAAPAKSVGSFDPDSIDNFAASKPAQTEATKPRAYRQTRGGRIYEDQLPAKDEKKPLVHPRTGRPW